MTVIDRLTAVAARLGKLPGRLGVPQYRKVIVQLPSGSQVEPEATWRVVEVDRATIGSYLSEQVQVSGEELLISGVPRKTVDYLDGFTKTTLEVCTFLLDAEYDSVLSKWSGTKARAVWVIDKDPLVYKVVVLPRRTV